MLNRRRYFDRLDMPAVGLAEAVIEADGKYVTPLRRASKGGTCMPQQDNWRWCSKCQGLWFNGRPDNGRCPADGQEHTSAGSGNYTLTLEAPVAGQQDNWRWCFKCEGLFFNGSRQNGTCPLDGGAHKNAGSGNYSLTINGPVAGQQDNWRWCFKCEGLHFGGSPGRCPAGGGQHETAGSGNYSLPIS